MTDIAYWFGVVLLLSVAAQIFLWHAVWALYKEAQVTSKTLIHLAWELRSHTADRGSKEMPTEWEESLRDGR